MLCSMGFILLTPSFLQVTFYRARISGLYCFVTDTPKLLCADDLKVYSVLFDWCTTNGLALNISKCKHMTYLLKIDDAIFQRCRMIRHLEIVFDHTLSFNDHIDHVVGAASRVRNTKSFRNITILKSLFCSLCAV